MYCYVHILVSSSFTLSPSPSPPPSSRLCYRPGCDSIDGIVASVMRHHPSARTPSKQSRDSATIISLEEPEVCRVGGEVGGG